MAKEKNWQELPIGGLIVDAGNAIEYNTGSWRAFRPIVDMEKCTHCLFCWLYCPDVAIIVKDGKMVGVDYGHCKGCAVCAEVCPPKCITMHPEYEFAEEG
jgi:2-oxoacid:acceptor oxidoreductase delta subunit (pyruvate/2-ketoisovalerate family)